MKKSVFILGFGLVLASSSCSSRYVLFDSEGFLTYNPVTGMYEIAWNNKQKPNQVVRDTIFVDSCNLKR